MHPPPPMPTQENAIGNGHIAHRLRLSMHDSQTADVYMAGWHKYDIILSCYVGLELFILLYFFV
jgi:hypothetical protein